MEIRDPEPGSELQRMWADMAKRRRWMLVRIALLSGAIAVLIAFPFPLADGYGFPAWAWRLFVVVWLASLLMEGWAWASNRQREAVSRNTWWYTNEINRIEHDNLTQWAAYHSDRHQREAEK